MEYSLNRFTCYSARLFMYIWFAALYHLTYNTETACSTYYSTFSRCLVFRARRLTSLTAETLIKTNAYLLHLMQLRPASKDYS